METEVKDRDFRLFVKTVRQYSKYDFSDYSDKSLKRMVAKVLSDNKTDINTLLCNISNNREYLDNIINKLTVTTTELFRDPLVWKYLRKNVLPGLKTWSTINIWHAGCSAGQEVYSMLILLNEAGMLERARIIATDINSEVLGIARSGKYRYSFNKGYLDNFDLVMGNKGDKSDGVTHVPYSRYLDIDSELDTISIKPFLLEKPVFKRHDLVAGEITFPGKFDLVICRNVVIYFNYSLQSRIFEMFYNHLHPGGFLVIGNHEKIAAPVSDRFIKTGRTYKKAVTF